MGKIVTAIIIVLVALLLFVAAPSCTDPEGTRRLLVQQGYSDVKITGYRHWMKDKNDWSSTGFEATSPAGQHVSGAVTAGILKGKTIRFD